MIGTRPGWLRLSMLAILLIGRPAWAMQFQVVPSTDNGVIIVARGEIHQGDTRLLRQALAEVPPGRTLLGMVVDSNGGNLAEGENLAAQISASQITVEIDSNSQCASACFLLLAGSPRRVVGTGALVGVHSASIEGKETTDSMAMTLQMQRAAATYGIPPAIIGKMAQTTPGRIEWLTHDDLASMNVRIVDDIDNAQVAAAAPMPGAPAAPMQLRPPMPAASRPASPPDVQAEFQGALFCQQGTAKLSLQILGSSAGAGQTSGGQTAVFNFGPMATSRQLPTGSFMMEGRLDLAGGGIDMRPTKWVSPQPANFTMVGLSGRSDDGGKTFSGHATVSMVCNVFTLKRTR